MRKKMMKRIYMRPELQVFKFNMNHHLLSMSIAVSSEAYNESTMTDLARENDGDFGDE